jgi:hypothetical protein
MNHALNTSQGIMSTSELKPIIFYDIPSIVQGQPWSPNTMKTRYVNRIQGLRLILGHRLS